MPARTYTRKAYRFFFSGFFAAALAAGVAPPEAAAIVFDFAVAAVFAFAGIFFAGVFVAMW